MSGHAPPPSGSLWKSNALTAILLAGDVLGFSAAWYLAYELRELLGRAEILVPINEFLPYAKVFPLVVGLGIANAAAFGLYLHRRRVSTLTRWGSLLKAGYHYLLYLMVVGYFFKELDLGRLVILFAALLAFGWLWGSRALLRRMKEAALLRGEGRVRALIVGTGDLAVEVLTSLRQHPDIGYEVVGLARHGESAPAAGLDGYPVLGEASDIEQLLARHHIEEVFVAVPHIDADEQLHLIAMAERPGLRIHLVSDLFGVLARDADVREIGQFPVVTLRDARLAAHEAVVKRLLDLLFGIAGLVVWILFFHWWIALRIRRDSPGPVFFVQERVGLHGRRFRILKYRTMHTDAAAYAIAPTEEGDPRITRFGQWLRRTSLDELPQLWNVLKGDMSLVGPRPEMPFIAEKYTPWQRRRLDVKPGITGLWQVIGRKNLPLHLNMEYDLYYVKNQSLLLDLEILLRTLPAVVQGRGAY
jgi:exopolysaccharide biosynthesis polyprenyl glycosylphosphotransferase